MKRIYLLVLLTALALPLAAASARGQRLGQHRRRRGLRRRRQQRRRVRNDYVELFNRGASSVADRRLDAPVRVRRRARRGSRPRSAARSRRAAGTSSSSPRAERTERRCPRADATGTSNLAVTGGKVAVVDGATALSCGASAGSCSAVSGVEDLVGYGSAADFEGSDAAPAGSATKALARAAAAAPTRTTTRPTSRPRRRIRRTRRRRRAPCSVDAAVGRTGGAAGVDVDVQPLLSISLDHPTLSFPAAVPGTTPAPLPEHVTVTSNDASGYTLGVHRTAFSPHDLPLGIGVGSGSLAAVPIAPAADLSLAGYERPERGRRRHGGDERRVRLAAPRRAGRALHGDADVHGDRQVRRALLALVLGAAAASIPGAAAGRGIALSASPLRLTLAGRVDARRSSCGTRDGAPCSSTSRGPASRARCAASRGCGRLAAARTGSGCTRGGSGSRRGAKASLHVRAVPPRRAAPGDHPALVLLTTRPLGVKHVRVRLRVGVVVVLRVRGPDRAAPRRASAHRSAPTARCACSSCGSSIAAT